MSWAEARETFTHTFYKEGAAKSQGLGQGERNFYTDFLKRGGEGQGPGRGERNFRKHFLQRLSRGGSGSGPRREKLSHTLFVKGMPRRVSGQAEARESFTHTLCEEDAAKNQGLGRGERNFYSHLLKRGGHGGSGVGRRRENF